MAQREHKLVKLEYQSGNAPGLQYYVECTCGWQGRLGTEQAAKSQYDNHLTYNGLESFFSKVAAKVETTKSEDVKTNDKQTSGIKSVAGSWKPAGA